VNSSLVHCTIVCIAMSIAHGCAHRPESPSAACEVEPTPGLYKVSKLSCDNPLEETDFCPLTQYIEIRSAADFGVQDAPRVLVQWYAESAQAAEYASVVESLRGHCTDEHTYVLHPGGQGRAWLTLRAHVPIEYGYETYTNEQPSKLLFRSSFKLEAAVRTPDIDRRLPVERE
jgi:hypothetical protein